MQRSLLTFLVLAGVAALQVAASAPRCQFEYVFGKGFAAPSGCPPDTPSQPWTDCCIVPMSKFDSFNPKPGKYTGVCTHDPVIRQGEPDICKKLGDRPHKKKPPQDPAQDPIDDDWTLH